MMVREQRNIPQLCHKYCARLHLMTQLPNGHLFFVFSLSLRCTRTYGFFSHGLPREVEVLDVSRDGHHKIQGVLVDDTFSDVKQLSRQTCEG